MGNNLINSESLALKTGTLYMSQSLTEIQRNFTKSTIEVVKTGGSWTEWGKEALKVADKVADKANQDIVNLVAEIGEKLPSNLQGKFQEWATSNLVNKLEIYFSSQMQALASKIEQEISIEYIRESCRMGWARNGEGFQFIISYL
jgi:hypothetical protein